MKRSAPTKPIKRAPPQEPPGFAEISAKLNAILERSSQIDQELMSLEAMKEQNGKISREMKSHGPDKYINFPDCSKNARCQRANLQFSTGRKEANKTELCQIMDIINELRMQVSTLATRQNQMKSELNKIRGRLC